jgi:C-terminal processing protease CtpA/Prc
VDSLAARVERLYVFADKGKSTAKSIRQRLRAKQYDRITSAREFADSLTAHLQSATNDLHLRVGYRNEPIPHEDPDAGPPEPELRRMKEMERRLNYGFESVRRLPGNVGYLDLRAFSGNPEGQTTAVAAMNFLAFTDALIIDLRRNGGGSPAMIATLLTYLTPEGDRVHFNDFYQRETDSIEQYWTHSYVPGPRLTGKPLYVLTSGRTFSGAEEFAYDVQNLHLGTVVGETTGGGAHPGGFFRLSEHFAAFIPTGRAISPQTHTNWEGTGVKPDVAVPAADALRTAHVAAIKKLLEDPAIDEERRTALGMALERAESTPPDPSEDFARPRRSGSGSRR